MKKVVLLFVLLFGILSSCQKDSNSLNHPTTYRVNGITDLQIGYRPGSTIYEFLNVVYVGPIQENVSLSLKGLPDGITVDTTQLHSGIPDFSTNFVLTNDGSAQDGTYTITLVCKGSETGEKSYTFTLTVLPTPTCSGVVSGAWAHNADCSGTLYTDSVILDPNGKKNRVVFTNFDGTGRSVYADLDCENRQLNIPNQTAGGHTYSGNGSFTGSSMYLYFVVDSARGGTFCSDNMTR